MDTLELRRLYEDGLSVHKIATLVGRSYSYVYDRLVSSGIACRSKNAPRLKPPDVEVLRAWYAAGKSTRDIAALSDASTPTVRAWLRAAGVKARTISEGKRAKGGQGPDASAVRASVKARRRKYLPGRPLVGYKVDGYGYVLLWNAEKQAYFREHRQVMEEKIGRALLPREDVHHKNGDRKDNRPENLELMASRSEHLREHAKVRRRKEGGRFA